MNRRKFLTNGSMAIASLAVASGAVVTLTGGERERLAGRAAGRAATNEAAETEGGLLSSSALRRATFARCVDTVFQLQHTLLGPIELKLSKLVEHAAAPGHEQFTLVFRGPQNSPLTGGTFVMTHAVTGHFPLYLESAGHDDGGSLFRADFNLLAA